MMDIGKLLLRILGGIGVLLYVGGVGYVIYLGLSKPPGKVPEIVDYYVMSISTTLATYIGMVVGFKQTGSGVKAGEIVPKSIRETIKLDWLQIAIAIIYIITLLSALGAWMSTGFDSEMTPIVQSLTKSLIGLVLGALTVYLNVPRT